MQINSKPYVLVTAARNEKDYIELTLKSVIAQTIKPMKWVIVSDRSDDGTDDIILKYAAIHPFIHFIRNNDPVERSTAAKVYAINLGLRVLENEEYDYIGNVDADVSFKHEYFATLLERFESDPSLGVIGGRIFQVDSRGGASEYKASMESVAGATQFFRKECFDQVGGYRPIKGGMEDAIAEITARYYGWKTYSYRDLPVLHHRELGTVGRSLFRTRFINGRTEFVAGYSFSYHALRALSRTFEKPYLIGAFLVFCGYAWGALSSQKKAIPAEIVQFIRQEQVKRLRKITLQHFHKMQRRRIA